MILLIKYLYYIGTLELTLEWAKTFEISGVGRMYFACEKDMNLGQEEQNFMGWILTPSKSYVEVITLECCIRMWLYLEIGTLKR